VVLLSTFLVKPEHVDDFPGRFQKQFAIMRKQPGLISAQLHRGIAGSHLFMNYVIWESTDAFKHGFESPELQAQLKQYPRPFAALLVVYAAQSQRRFQSMSRAWRGCVPVRDDRSRKRQATPWRGPALEKCAWIDPADSLVPRAPSYKHIEIYRFRTAHVDDDSAFWNHEIG
jgi:heme-degrading monooxygenase HmoA